MRISTAVILAAGRGTRLAGAGVQVPKGLVEIGGEALVSRSVRQLSERGITDIMIVTGHQAALYDAFAAARVGVRCVYNERFDVMGSLESLRCALSVTVGPFLLLDSDILYESRGLDALLQEPGEHAALVSGLTGSGDEYYVWTDGGRRIRYFSKSLEDQADAPAGEHVGILKVGPALSSALLARAPAHLERKPLDSYETLLIDLLGQHRVMNAEVKDLRWSEIDNEAMLDTARNVIWPALVALGDV
jgi:2-aminoethylphosphonate-pyruvate transaminase